MAGETKDVASGLVVRPFSHLGNLRRNGHTCKAQRRRQDTLALWGRRPVRANPLLFDFDAVFVSHRSTAGKGGSSARGCERRDRGRGGEDGLRHRHSVPRQPAHRTQRPKKICKRALPAQLRRCGSATTTSTSRSRSRAPARTPRAPAPVAERGVRSDGVVIAPPAFDHDLSLAQGVEDLAVEQFVAEPGIGTNSDGSRSLRGCPAR